MERQITANEINRNEHFKAALRELEKILSQTYERMMRQDISDSSQKHALFLVEWANTLNLDVADKLNTKKVDLEKQVGGDQGDIKLFQAKLLAERGAAAETAGLNHIGNLLFTHASSFMSDLGSRVTAQNLSARATFPVDMLKDKDRTLTLAEECMLCAMELVKKKEPNLDQATLLWNTTMDTAKKFGLELPNVSLLEVMEVRQKKIRERELEIEVRQKANMNRMALEARERQMEQFSDFGQTDDVERGRLVGMDTLAKLKRKEQMGDELGFVTAMRISELYGMYKNNELDLDPEFQRERNVWPRSVQQTLAGDIVLGKPLSEIYIGIKEYEDGRPKKVLIDGKQRLTSLFMFQENEFRAYLAKENQETLVFHFKSLTSEAQERFTNYPVVVRMKKFYDPEELREEFLRWNQNAFRLNKNEIANATRPTDFKNLVIELAASKSLERNGVLSKVQTQRMLDRGYAANLLASLIEEGPVDGPNTGAVALYKKYSQNLPDKEKLRERYLQTESTIERLIPDLPHTVFSYRSDYYALFVALDQLSSVYTIPSDSIPKIKEKLIEFRNKVDKEKAESASKDVRDYFSTINSGSNRITSRKIRVEILKKTMLPYLERSKEDE